MIKKRTSNEVASVNSYLMFSRTRSRYQLRHSKHTRLVNIYVHCLSKKRQWRCTLFNAHQPILVIFGRDIAERIW